MGTKRVTRSGKEQCVSNKPYFNFIEETLVSASGVKTKVCMLPPGAFKEEFKEGCHHYHGVVLERFGCGVNPHGHIHSNSSAQNIQNRKKGFTRGCKVNYLRKRSKRLAHKLIKYGKKLAPVPYFNFTEETLVSASGVKTKVCMLSPGEMYSALNEEFKEGSHHYHGVVLDRFCIGTRHSNPEMRGNDAVPSMEQTSSLASCIEEITKHVEFLKQELAKPSPSMDCLKWADLLFSWIPKIRALPTYSQLAGECWSVALSRGHAYYMAANKIDGKKVTSEQLLNGVSKEHLMSSGGLVRLENAKEFLVANKYVKDMIVHRRPSHPDDFAGFEILLEKLLARGPMVVVFDILPDYKDYDGKGIYTPEDDTVWRLAALERFKQHSVVVTGCGVGLVEGEPIEFWQTHDSQYAGWGVDGFGKLARRKHLIVAAVEFKVK